jgi:hypothetical protein
MTSLPRARRRALSGPVPLTPDARRRITPIFHSRRHTPGAPSTSTPETPRSITPISHLRRSTPGASSAPTPETPRSITHLPRSRHHTPDAPRVDVGPRWLVRSAGGPRDRIAASSWWKRSDPLDWADSSREVDPIVDSLLLGSWLRALNCIEGEVSCTLAGLCLILGEVSCTKPADEAQIGVR